eukprot:TRINITY_DN37831_c0_g1_i1.p1 TRINITY_DN37831_c0_g1~~TRINITY_DN37831_c0_g1_i1.p1  ORF type:complete len:234 (-),score=34.52 TRINITY_DN37831_c0_g1_i1:78-779(-)
MESSLERRMPLEMTFGDLRASPAAVASGEHWHPRNHNSRAVEPPEERPAQGPERPPLRQRPPFAWKAAPDYEKEFQISGASSEVATKLRDFKDPDWVVPIGGTMRLLKGSIYRWTLCIERLCPHRPQMHVGVHGAGHRRPWRLMTTTRCSRARDEDAWQERPGGDRAIQEGDFLHLEVDLRGLHLPFGTLSVAVNSEPEEVVFDDIPLTSSLPMMPVVCMGGDQSRVRLCPAQ